MNYILRDIPSDLWRRVKAKAALKGLSVKEVILDLLTKWVER